MDVHKIILRLCNMRSYSVALETQATAKHKWHKFTFEPNKNSLSDILEELNEFAEQAFRDQAQQLIDSFLYARMPPNLKESIELA